MSWSTSKRTSTESAEAKSCSRTRRRTEPASTNPSSAWMSTGRSNSGMSSLYSSSSSGSSTGRPHPLRLPAYVVSPSNTGGGPPLPPTGRSPGRVVLPFDRVGLEVAAHRRRGTGTRRHDRIDLVAGVVRRSRGGATDADLGQVVGFPRVRRLVAFGAARADAVGGAVGEVITEGGDRLAVRLDGGGVLAANQLVRDLGGVLAHRVSCTAVVLSPALCF